MNAEQIRKLADGFPSTSTLPEILRACALVAQAAKELTDDIADRFDLDSPSTNPGIKVTVRASQAALAKLEAIKP